MKKTFLLILAALSLLSGCATTSYQKGILANGEKAYMGPSDIENTQEFKEYLNSKQTEADKQVYLFKRLKGATDLEFYHDGSWYKSLEAYRGGMWLMRHRYKKDQSTRDFIKTNIERSEAGNIHIAKYPDGSLQIGSYVLYNELDLLEEKAKKTA